MTLSALYQLLSRAALDGDVLGDATITLPRADLRGALVELEKAGVLRPGGVAIGSIDDMQLSLELRDPNASWDGYDACEVKSVTTPKGEVLLSTTPGPVPCAPLKASA